MEHVVIGAFSVIFHGYVRGTKDSDILVPDGSEADAAVLRFLERVDGRGIRDNQALTLADIEGVDNLRVNSRHGIVDILRGGVPPLDYETVAARADTIEWHGQTIRIAALPSIVGFKRLAGRPQDNMDLSELEAIHGELPVDPIPGLDD